MAARHVHGTIKRITRSLTLWRRWPSTPIKPLPIPKLCFYPLQPKRALQGKSGFDHIYNVYKLRKETNQLSIQSYELLTDPYSKAPRLNLFAFDGAPLNPMWQVYKPPIMLPTQTLNPTTAFSTGGAKSTASSTAKVRRALFETEEEMVTPLNRNALIKRKEPIDADKWWWIGAGMTAVGGVGYLCF